MALRDEVRAAISNAYYMARNDGQTMEFAADQATSKVMRLIDQHDPTFGRSESPTERSNTSGN